MNKGRKEGKNKGRKEAREEERKEGREEERKEGKKKERRDRGKKMEHTSPSTTTTTINITTTTTPTTNAATTTLELPPLLLQPQPHSTISTLHINNTSSSSTNNNNSSNSNNSVTPSTTTTTTTAAAATVCLICGDSSPQCDKIPLTTTATTPATATTYLQLLSVVLGSSVSVANKSIFFCKDCLSLAHDIDSTLQVLYSHRSQLMSRLNNNNLPKVTMQYVASPTTATPAAGASGGLNLDDLAATRSRRGKRKPANAVTIAAATTITTTITTTTTTITTTTTPTTTMTTTTATNTATTATTTASTATTTATTATGAATVTMAKRRGGRPRKPFSCTICRRKFLNISTLRNHLKKDHHIATATTAASTVTTANTTNTATAITTGTFCNVKVENVDTATTSTCAAAATTTATVLKSEVPLPLLLPQPSPSLPQLQPKPSTTNTIASTTTAITSTSATTTTTSTTNHLLSLLRPIQPKPQRSSSNGSKSSSKDSQVIVVVKNGDMNSTAAVISVPPNYHKLGGGNSSGVGGLCLPPAAATNTNSCEICCKIFTDEKSKRMHKIAAHFKKRDKAHTCLFPCAHCHTPTAFPTRRKLNAHIRTCHRKSTDKTKKTFVCTHCEEKFVYKYELNAHMDTHLMYTQKGVHEIVCVLCGLHVASLAALKIHAHRFHAHVKNPHKRSHSQFLCAFCGELTHTRKDFLAHMRTHTQEEEKVHTREQEINTQDQNMYTQSQKTHTGGQKMHMEGAMYVDDQKTFMDTEKVYTNPQKVYALTPHVHMDPQKTHMDPQKTYMNQGVHTDQETYTVQEMYTQDPKLHIQDSKIHTHGTSLYTEVSNVYAEDPHMYTDGPLDPQKTHTKKTVTCKFCGKSMLSSSLHTHIRRIHMEKTIPCVHCDQKFHVRSDLMRHVNHYHFVRKSYECGLCALTFSSCDALRYHRNKVHSTQTHTCTHCKKTYTWKGELRTHILRAHKNIPVRFQCPACTRSYMDRKKLGLHMAAKHGQKQDDEEEEENDEDDDDDNDEEEKEEEEEEEEDQEQQQLPIQQQQLPLKQLENHSPATTSLTITTTAANIASAPTLPITTTVTPYLAQPPQQPAFLYDNPNTREIVQEVINPEVYLVPNISVPIHEEQVTTS